MVRLQAALEPHACERCGVLLWYPEPGPYGRRLRSDAVFVGLADFDYRMLEDVADARTAATAGIPDRSGREWTDRRSRRLLGAAGELAVARWLGLAFDPSPYGLDVGPYNVRTRSRWDYDLLVQDHDVRNHPDTPYVLVTAPDGVPGPLVIRGWITPAETVGRWRSAPGGYSPAAFVPADALHDVRRLQQMLSG